MAHRLYSQGDFYINGNEGAVNQLEGRFAFINQLDKYNNKIDKSGRHSFRTLNSREKEYRLFLFYKYFYASNKPIIVTEGKTDIAYLKSALKNLYMKYPKLIKLDGEGTFELKISFLRRSKRFSYLFGVSADGADSMISLYRFFDSKSGDKNNYPDLYGCLEKKCNCQPRNPIIFLFDNELGNSSKPLSKFVSQVNLDDHQLCELNNELWTKLKENCNLYLATIPLPKDKNECEIEDLFQDNTLRNKINGKTFTRQNNYDTSKYYGKQLFSEYISKNYKNIDFSGFNKVLDNLNLIVDHFKM